MDETVTTDTTATDTGTASSGTGDLDLDTLIAQAAAASSGAADETVTEPAADASKEASTEADTAAAAVPTDIAKEDTAPATADAEAEIDARRARRILAAAKEREAKSAQDFLTELRRNPRAALAKHKLSLEELIDADLASDEPRSDTKPQNDDERMAAIEKRLEAKFEAKLQEQRNQEILNGKIAAVKDGIKADQSLTLINRSNSSGDVIDFMQEYYNAHGQPIPWQKAAQLVEKGLRERFGEPSVSKAAVSKPAVSKPGEPAKTAPSATSTLTNNEVRTASPSDDEPQDPDQLIKFLVAKAERNSNTSH